jgi:Na+/melibiose symporter-like transporter
MDPSLTLESPSGKVLVVEALDSETRKTVRQTRVKNKIDKIPAQAEITATLPRMAGFSLPALGLNMLVTSVFVFLPALYTEHLGLGAATVGTVFLLAKIVDVIAAPSLGLFMDSYSTRWGRRRPWLALSTPILILAILMLFIPQGAASVVYLFIWLCVLYIGWSLWTISHTSWALELSRDYDRRSRITGLLQVFAMLGGIVMALIPAVMERVATPTYEEKTAAIGWFMMVLLPLTAILCLASLPERRTPNRPHLGFKRGAALVFSNMALLRVLVANATLGFSWVLLQALFVFFVTYALGLEDWLGFLLVCLIIGGLLFLPVWVKLSHSWHKHGAMQASMLMGAATLLLLLFLPEGNVVLAAVAFVLVGANSSALEFLPRAMMADVCDHDHIQSGSERMALYYSLLQLSSKVAAGFTVFIALSILGTVGFDPEIGSENSAEAIRNLRYVIVGLPAFAYASVVIMLLGYPISRERQHSMRAEIEERERLVLEPGTNQPTSN